MKKIWDQLWYPAPKPEIEARHKAMCISFITYSTEARTIEICNLKIGDLEEVEDNGVTFLRCPLRTSKTNTRKTTRESIILTITKKEMYPILKWIKKVIGKRKKGYVFPMGYVLNSSLNGIDDEHIVNVCRWKVNTMLKYSRNHFLETTIHGSAYKMAMENDKARQSEMGEKRSTNDKGTQTTAITTETPTKKKQNVLRVIKIMTTSETQTEKNSIETEMQIDNEQPVSVESSRLRSDKDRHRAYSATCLPNSVQSATSTQVRINSNLSEQLYFTSKHIEKQDQLNTGIYP
ncbi:unnamed protein product [Oikopleura dioica]|uniref:Uncharacterized protein n=1 Tax=Oikopleura dioica TaxID=34765 RepID=E4XLB7_OIKDI|nr:unnamed protein product [Oikopleura dioica]